MFRTGSFTSSLYVFLQSLTSAELKVCTSSRSFGPVPRGKWAATISRQRASLLPLFLRRLIVAPIHFRSCAALSWLSEVLKSCSSSASGVCGCHFGSRAFSTSHFWSTHFFQKSGVFTRSGSLSSRFGKSSLKMMTPSLSTSNSWKRSLDRCIPVMACQFTPILPTPSANSCELILPLPFKSSFLKAARGAPPHLSMSSRRMA
mmetsp:Transcript_22772/g.53627  ORF Transcript_22772/g.53627 Transcript_22772/m.53627 type:complete len:203 (-) Transcript_22772:884-1492(-)